EEFVHLVGVICEVVEFPPRVALYDGHPPRPRNYRPQPRRRVEAKHGALLVFFYDHAISRDRETLLAQRRQEAHALNAIIGLDASSIEDRRGDVERTAEHARGPRRAVSGLSPNEGRARDPLVMRGPLQEQPVVAEEITVVASKDNDSVIGEPAAREMIEHPADGVVDHGDHSAAQRHGLARFPLTDGEGGLPSDIGLSALPLRQRPGDRPGERAIAVVEAWW